MRKGLGGVVEKNFWFCETFKQGLCGGPNMGDVWGRSLGDVWWKE